MVTPGEAERSEPFLDPIPLPETRRVSSGRQRERRRRRQRRQGLAALGALLLAVLVLVALVTALVGHARHSSSGAKAKGAGAAPALAAPPVLLAQQDGAGAIVSLTVLAPEADGKGGSLVLVPPGVMAEVVSADLQPVARAFSLGGAPRLLSTVSNLLGATLADVDVVDSAGLGALVAPAGPLTVDVPERVESVDASGLVQVLYRAGPTTVQPADAAKLLAAKGRGNDLSRLARHQAFWDAWLARLAKQPSAVPAQPQSLHRALAALAAGQVRTRVVPVTALGTTGDDGELYKVDGPELRRMVETAFPPGARAGDRPRVQILNGTGAIGLAQRVQDRLGAGVEVRLTGNASSFDFPQTKIVFYDKAKQVMAERVRKQLGVGTLVFSRNPIDVVDVTVVVGKDFT